MCFAFLFFREIHGERKTCGKDHGVVREVLVQDYQVKVSKQQGTPQDPRESAQRGDASRRAVATCV